MLQPKNYSEELSNSRANNSVFPGLITPIIKLIRDLKVIYILTNFGTDYFIFVDARMQTKSNIAFFLLIQGQITPFVLVRVYP